MVQYFLVSVHFLLVDFVKFVANFSCLNSLLTFRSHNFLFLPINFRHESQFFLNLYLFLLQSLLSLLLNFLPYQNGFLIQGMSNIFTLWTLSLPLLWLHLPRLIILLHQFQHLRCMDSTFGIFKVVSVEWPIDITEFMCYFIWCLKLWRCGKLNIIISFWLGHLAWRSKTIIVMVDQTFIKFISVHVLRWNLEVVVCLRS